jgi:outer membrane murein-binding lipoprotein Lpp
VSAARVRRAACTLAAAALGTGLLGGCASMSSALGQQWVDVQLASNTTMASAQQLSSACSHVPGIHADRVRPTAPGAVVDSVRFDTTQASDADMARLQRCLQRFPVVQGLTIGEPGD